MTDAVGFIGVGTMGGPMASNLQRAGKRLIVHDIRREAAETLCANGALWVDDFEAMRRETDVIVTSLPGPKEIEQVAFGPSGLVGALGTGALWIGHEQQQCRVGLSPRRGLRRCGQRVCRCSGYRWCGGRARRHSEDNGGR